MGRYNIERPKMADIIPEGTSDVVRVEHFTVSEQASRFSMLRAAINHHRREEGVPPGRYARLFVNGDLYMSDTDQEWHTNLHVIMTATGDVLIAGLGLGFILLPLLSRQAVRSITVVEKHPDVITLVEKPLRVALGQASDRLTIVQADIYEWRPPQKYSTIYFDIWAGQSTDDLKGMTKLKRRFTRALDRSVEGAWMGCWREDELRRRKRSERNAPWSDYARNEQRRILSLLKKGG